MEDGHSYQHMDDSTPEIVFTWSGDLPKQKAKNYLASKNISR